MDRLEFLKRLGGSVIGAFLPACVDVEEPVPSDTTEPCVAAWDGEPYQLTTTGTSESTTYVITYDHGDQWTYTGNTYPNLNGYASSSTIAL